MDAIAAVKCRRVRLGQGSAGFVTGSGRVELDGHDPDGLPPHERAHRGLARTWQGTELFHDLDVRENLMVAVGRPGTAAGPEAARGRGGGRRGGARDLRHGADRYGRAIRAVRCKPGNADEEDGR